MYLYLSALIVDPDAAAGDPEALQGGQVAPLSIEIDIYI